MAVYKVLQDIEAEDKLIGTLTLKQFIFAAIAFIMLFAGWYIGQATSYIALFLMLIPAAPFIFLASPIGTDQPNDVWLAAQLRFRLKPRIRKWDQTGQSELVKITAPKTLEHIYTDGLSDDEVKSRLKALASTLDSRGWAVKNVAINLANPTADAANNDRLVGSIIQQDVPDLDLRPSDDVLDGQGTVVGRHFQDLMDTQTIARREEAINIINQARERVSDPQASTATATSVQNSQQNPQSDEDVAALAAAEASAKQAEAVHEAREHIAHASNTSGWGQDFAKTSGSVSQQSSQAQVDDFGVQVHGDELSINHHANPAIINELALAKDELKVSTLSSLAESAEKRDKDVLQDDQIIELH